MGRGEREELERGVVPSTSRCELWSCLVRGLGAGADCGLLGGLLGVTAGWGGTQVPMDVSSRRLVLVLHRHLAERGLLSFLRLLRAFWLLTKRNQA